MLSMTFTYPGEDLWNIEYAFAQLPNSNLIQILSTSTFIDDFGNFHVIGEVNNTSFDPQTNILITTILSDTTNNIIVGNHSAFSSIGTLRPGELSSFDILIPDPQIVGKFNFIEFSTSSQLGIEKPANLVLNGSNTFFDNVGNPHITGYIINQGQFPEQFLNLVTTFYDNSSQGVVGTQSFGLNVANLTQNQMAPFDITIFDNKTKSQAKFYSLNVDSVQNSMDFPFNPKFSFEPVDEFVDNGLFLDSPLNNDPGFTNDVSSNNNNGQSSSSGSNNGNSGQSSSSDDLEIEIDIAKDPISPKNDQTIEVTISDSDTDEKIRGAEVESKVHYASGTHVEEKAGQTNNEGIFEHEWEIGGNSKKGTFNVVIDVEANGYKPGSERASFEVDFRNITDIDTDSQDNITNIENINSTTANDVQDESNEDLDCGDINEKNIPIGNNDPNNLDADGDGIGCEDNNNNGVDDVDNQRGDESNDDSNPCTAEQASRDHTCTSSSGDNDEIDDWTDPPVEEENNESSESDGDGDGENPTTDSQNDVNESENYDNDGSEEESNSEESDNN